MTNSKYRKWTLMRSQLESGTKASGPLLDWGASVEVIEHSALTDLENYSHFQASQLFEQTKVIADLQKQNEIYRKALEDAASLLHDELPIKASEFIHNFLLKNPKA